jgi:hypothetical protein
MVWEFKAAAPASINIGLIPVPSSLHGRSSATHFSPVKNTFYIDKFL